MTAQLSVNLNAIALLRNRRDLPWPSVTALGAIALESGAHGLTVHPRPDERHIRRTDVFEIKQLINQDFKGKEFNIEGYPTDDFLKLIKKARPDQVTLVPDDPSQATSDHGWDIPANEKLLNHVIKQCQSWGCRVSLFMDPDPRVLKGAKDIGADRVELYTGPYGACFEKQDKKSHLDDLLKAAGEAKDLGLGLNAGHDLTLDNLPALVKGAPDLLEVSIGHGLTADCLLYGMKGAVERYIAVLKGAK